MFLKIRHVHFVGIGGIGMSGIAEVLLNLGHVVSGSDLRATAVTRRLQELGARVQLGHDATHVEGAHVVVVSSAVPPSNPEVAAAQARGIPVIQRAEMLAELMRLKLGIALAGAHGKTTATSMTAHILFQAGLDPTVVNGGRIGSLGSSSRLGRGEFMVAEADESDRSFLRLSPVIAVATNLDEEHMESYRDMQDMAEAYREFLDKVPFYGAAILCADDPWLAELAGRLHRPAVRYGIEREADLTARSLKAAGGVTRFTLRRQGHDLGELELPVPGRHNVLNALAAVAVALELEVPFETVARALAGFEGADRRMQVLGETRDVLVMDDYGHHPTEITATLAALREHLPRRVIAIFQPHRYSRVARLQQRFAASFAHAAVVLVTDIYPASEPPLPGITGEAMAETIRQAGHPEVHFVGDLDAAVEQAAALARSGDLVVTLGAGSVTSVGPRLLERLRS